MCLPHLASAQSTSNSITPFYNFSSIVCYVILGAKRIHMPVKESFDLNGENLLKKIKELIEEGNIRKITITDKEGKELMSFPLNIGVVAAVLAPVLAAVGALAALITECRITVERDDEEGVNPPG
jgi:hypothetical protein